MTKLEPPDSHHAIAAIGWLELGNHVEAGEELARVSAANLNHPDVLEVRWAVCAEGKSWDAAAEVAESLVAVAPERSSGWVHRAYAVRRMRGGSLERAEKLLLAAFDKFPKESVIPYNLACYAAQLGRLDEAWDWLLRAAGIEGKVEVIRERGLCDSDLEPLWQRIRQWCD
jgi:Flp pilus assembly protein TadD